MNEVKEDEYVVIIVDDDNVDPDKITDIPAIKQELEDYPTYSGTNLDFDQIENYLGRNNQEDSEHMEYLEDEIVIRQHKLKRRQPKKIIKQEIESDYTSDNQSDYIPLSDEENEIEFLLNKNSTKKAKKNKRKTLKVPKDSDEEWLKDTIEKKQERINKAKYRWRRPDPTTWKSRVQEILQDNPSMEPNDIIKTMAIEMMNLEPPPLPENSYTEVEEGFQCKTCYKIKKFKGQIERHCQEHHGPRYLVCFACGADYRSKECLYKHEKRCQAIDAPLVLKARAIQVASQLRPRNEVIPDLDIPVKLYHCSHCPEYFPMKAALQCHVKKHERKLKEDLIHSLPVKEFKCSKCKFSYDEKKDLILHERMHALGRPFQCELCPRAYKSRPALYKHSFVHKNMSFECELCNRIFKDKKSLNAHFDTHAEPRFCCTECPKRYSYKAALQLHVHRKHRNLPPPCACTICPKRFNRFYYLEQHMKKQHGVAILTKTTFIKRLPEMTEKEISEARILDQAEIYRPSDLHTLQETKIKVPVEIEENPEDQKQDFNNALKVVVLDDSEIDFDAVVLHQQLNDDKIIVIENGKIKNLTDEELKKVEANHF